MNDFKLTKVLYIFYLKQKFNVVFEEIISNIQQIRSR